MVFGSQIIFSIPPPKNSAPKIFFGPQSFFSAFFFSAPKTQNRLFRRAPKEQYFSAPKRKHLGFFLAPPRYGVRRPNNFFDPPKIFFGPQKYFSAFLFFRCSEKPPLFGAQNQKSAFSAGAEGAKSCILGSPAIRASGDENFPSRFEGVPGVSWNPSGGSTKASNEGFMKPP